MFFAAFSKSADKSTYTGALPGPTPIAGLEEEYADRTIAEPPVANVTDVLEDFISSSIRGIVGFSII